MSSDTHGNGYGVCFYLLRTWFASRGEATAAFSCHFGVTNISAARASGCGTPDPEPPGTPARVHPLQRISGFGHTPDSDPRQLSQSWNPLGCGKSALAQPWIWQEESVLASRFSLQAGVFRLCFTRICPDPAGTGMLGRAMLGLCVDF